VVRGNFASLLLNIVNPNIPLNRELPQIAGNCLLAIKLQRNISWSRQGKS